MKEPHLLIQCLAGLPFQHLEQQGELCHLSGLAVDIHAVDVVEQNALAFGGGEVPAIAMPMMQDRFLCLGPFFRVVTYVPRQMPLQQILVRPQQERT